MSRFALVHAGRTIAISLVFVCAAVLLVAQQRTPKAATAQTLCNGTYYAAGNACGQSGSSGCPGPENAYSNGYGCIPNTTTPCPIVPATVSAQPCSSVTTVYCGGNGAYPTAFTCPNGTTVFCGGAYRSGVTNCPGASLAPCGAAASSAVFVCASPMVCPDGAVISTGQACPGTASCPSGQQVYSGQSCPSLTVSSAIPVTPPNYGNAAPAAASTAPPAAGFGVSYNTGWNIVAGPSSTVFAGTIGSLYAFRPGDTAYEPLASGSSVTSGVGYWAYFGSPTNASLAISGSSSVTIPLPAGQFVLIGNPGNSTASVTGADEVLVYSPSGGYTQTTQLGPGQGAWAISTGGGQAIINAG